jgi:hypothetical protein
LACHLTLLSKEWDAQSTEEATKAKALDLEGADFICSDRDHYKSQCDAADSVTKTLSFALQKAEHERDAAQELLKRIFGKSNCFNCHCRAYSIIYGHLICTFGGKETPDDGRRPDCPYLPIEKEVVK